MNGVITAISTLIFAAMAMGLIESLLPPDSLKNRLKIITGAVMILSVLSSILSLRGEKLPDINDFEPYTGAPALQKAAANCTAADIRDIFTKYGVKTDKITVYTDKTDDGRIVIIKAYVSVHDADVTAANSAATAARDALGITVTLENGGANENNKTAGGAYSQ